MKARYDIVIVGSGFAGSIMAMVARRLGHSVLLIERGQHPRVVIGESSTPLSNLLLEEIADRYDLSFLKPLTKWGSWQKSYPQLPCGLKRGFSFFDHGRHDTDCETTYVDREMFVAASPHDRIADTHWFRADFDHFLVQQAMQAGVEYIDQTELNSCLLDGNCRILTGSRGTESVEIRTSFVIDASGPRGFLHRALGLQESAIADYPATSSLYCHFKEAGRFEESSGWPLPHKPYPVDDAALHHVFAGGWIWVLRFNNGWTSAGVAATDAVARRFNFAEGEPAWHRLLDTLPLVKAQVAHAKNQTSFRYVPQLSFLSAQIAGDRWAMLPTAAGFADPLLSTGIPVALLGISRLATLLEGDWESNHITARLGTYADETRSDLMAAARLIGCLYRHMGNFPLFRTLTLLYFAAATYTETARRLNKPELAQGFLLNRHPVFGPECSRLLTLANHLSDGASRHDLERDIYKLIESFDVAGLCKRPKDHTYPVSAADLFAGAHTLGASLLEIEDLLERSGFLVSRPI